LTDNGKVFTGRLGPHPSEVLFDRICREHGITHLLTGIRAPTTTGKIERFHKRRVQLNLDRVTSGVELTPNSSTPAPRYGVHKGPCFAFLTSGEVTLALASVHQYP
jgi:transposase InsO family protein